MLNADVSRHHFWSIYIYLADLVYINIVATERLVNVTYNLLEINSPLFGKIRQKKRGF